MAMDFKGKAADGKVVAHVKYVPVTNPMDPNPDYEVISIEIDDTYFEETSPEDLSASLADAYQNGVEETNKAVMEKYQTLTTELSDVFGGKA
jgi:DNA-binding protein YbaB